MRDPDLVKRVRVPPFPEYLHLGHLPTDEPAILTWLHREVAAWCKNRGLATPSAPAGYWTGPVPAPL